MSEDEWKSISSVPSVIIQGMDDQITTFEEASKLYQLILGNISAAEGFIDMCPLNDCGHMIMQEKPEIAIQKIS